MLLFIRLFYCVIIFFLFSCGGMKQESLAGNSYKLYYTTATGSRVLWDSCSTLSSLHAPWEENRAGGTIFQAYYDPAFLHFRFVVRDSSIAVSDSLSEEAVALGDRVELFFSADTSLNDYYCLELSPAGRVLDYQASWYRKFNSRWNLEGLNIQTSHTATGYSVAGSIPLLFFRELTGSPALTGKKIFLGIFRAETMPGHEGRDFTWFSWINPRSGQPDFHIPSAFGELIF